MRMGVKKSEWINQITTHVLESKTWPSSNVMDAWLNGIIGFKWITFDWKENIVFHQNLFFFCFFCQGQLSLMIEKQNYDKCCVYWTIKTKLVAFT